MEKNCYHCGASIDERSPFCPSCGTAQIRVSPRESSSETPGEPEGLSNEPPSSRGPEGYSSAIMHDGSSTIRWRQYFKAAWPLALVAGTATALLPPLGFLLFLPIAVIVSLRLYRKHHLGQIRIGQGALLGVALSILSFVAVVAIYALFYPAISSHFRDAMVQGLNDSQVRNANPESAQAMRNLLDTPDGVLVLFSVVTFMVFCINTVFASLAGALAANLGHDKKKP